MSFVAAFYSFTIDLNHSDRGIFTRFRMKVPRHPAETLQHLNARMIAFLHQYQDDLTFSEGFFEPKEPTFLRRDITEELLLWGQVGAPERRKIEVALRAGPQVEYVVYFYQSGQIQEFCHYLRGSKTNWIKPVRFYEIDENFLNDLSQTEQSSPEWNITFVDNHIYVTCEGTTFESDLLEVDMWSAYQTSLIDSEQIDTDT